MKREYRLEKNTFAGYDLMENGVCILSTQKGAELQPIIDRSNAAQSLYDALEKAAHPGDCAGYKDENGLWLVTNGITTFQRPECCDCGISAALTQARELMG